MVRFLFSLSLLFILLPVRICVGETTAPNVLFIAIDDLRPELGCYGAENVHSPNIDRLAREGVRFDNAHCQLAVCNPSRVSLLTGLRPDSTRVWTLDVRFRHTIPDAVTLPQHFKQCGYTTLGFGKIFHNPWPDNQSWSEPHSWPKNSKLWSQSAKQELAAFKKTLHEQGVAQRKIDRLRAKAVEIVSIPDHEHIDGAIAQQTLTAMRRLAKQEKPFFLAAGFVRPHLPFVVPEKYWDLYQRDKIPLANQTSFPQNSPPFAMNTMYELRDYFDYLKTPDPRSGSLTEAQQRELKHGYLASVSFIDAQTGLLLDELDKLGLADNTIVVLWSDHGWKLGEHNSWCKQTNYEIDTRVPLIIRDPRAKGNGQVCRSPVELLDLYPTLSDLAGLPIPEKLQGTSLRPVLTDPAGAVKEAAFSQFPRRYNGREIMGYACRTDRWRYIEWIDRNTGKTIDRELYDHSIDPGERTNVASLEEHIEVRNHLSTLIRKTHPFPAAAKPDRPKLHFKNETTHPLEVTWLPGGDQPPRKSGTVKPGGTLTQNTTKGHLFHVTSPGINRVISVTKQNETITFRDIAPPNIVVIMGDDWSYPHTSIYGDKTVKTPAFDRIAREGILFTHAYTPAPSCTPSRHAFASGQYHWRPGVGADLGSSIAKDIPVYPDLLSASGYRTGFCRKGTGPSEHKHRGNDPFGKRYKNFREFIDQQKNDAPSCFWYGAGEPHRPYKIGEGTESKSIVVPPWLPDNETTRADLADYYNRVEKLDQFAGDILQQLEASGELENTIVVMTGDNGMPFPRAKATLYDSGTRVPLAIRWGKQVKGGRTVDGFVSLTDLAPTFLEASGLPIPAEMTGRSLLDLLLSKTTETPRRFILTGMERHVYPNPSRAIRTRDFLYIRNFSPRDWPTGTINGPQPEFDFAKTPWPTVPGAFSHNIDPGPTKQWMRLNDTKQNFQAFVTRPGGELYDLRKDPHQLNNLLSSDSLSEKVENKCSELSDLLTTELRASGDPRFIEPGHATFSLNGWQIHLNDKLWSHNRVRTSIMLDLLDNQLQRVVDTVPKPALAKIRQIPIWLNPPYKGKRGTAEYHPARGWLENNGRNPKMAKCVEITNVDIFAFEDRRMPYVILHELAHGYHDRFIPGGYGNEKLRAAHENAVKSGVYDEVDRFDGNRIRKDRAYALTNPMEYFAESTEAYFGKNDFFPFNRKELRENDGGMYELVGELWGAGQ